MTSCLVTRCDTALCLIGQQDFSVRKLNTENRPSLRFTPFSKRRFPICVSNYTVFLTVE